MNSDWSRVPAKYLLIKQNHPCEDNDGVVTAFRDGEVVLRSERRIDGFTEATEFIGYQGVKTGELVVHSMDAFAGAIGISKSDGRMSPVVHIYKGAKNVELRFYAYYLRHLSNSGFIQSLSKGIRERSTSFDTAILKEIKLPFPPIEEQRRIADILTDTLENKIDNIVKSIRRNQYLIKELWISNITEIFNTIIERVPLKYLFYVQNGNSLSAEFIEENNLLTTDGIDFIATKDVDTSSGVNTDSDIKIPEYLRHQFRIAPKGAVLICSEGGSAGKKFAVTHRDVHYGNKLFSCTPRSAFSSDILYYFFHTQEFKNSFNYRMNGMIGGISKEDFGNIHIPKISAEQFENLRMNMDIGFKRYLVLNSKLEKLLGLLEEYRQTLITELVTGTRGDE